VHNFNWFGIFAFAFKYINCICSRHYLADSFNSYRGEKIDEVQVLLTRIFKNKKFDLKSNFLLSQQDYKPNSVPPAGGCDHLSARDITVGIKRTTFNPSPYASNLKLKNIF